MLDILAPIWYWRPSNEGQTAQTIKHWAHGMHHLDSNHPVELIIQSNEQPILIPPGLITYPV